MALPERFTKTDAAALLDISRDTLDKRIADEVYIWPPSTWPALIEQEFSRRMHGGAAADSDDARFRRARADVHEIGAARQRGEVAPVEMFEEQIVAVFGLFVQETEGACARLLRSAGLSPLAEAIRSEFGGFRQSLARSVERYCESLEERARGSTAGAGPGRGRVGTRGADSAVGERGAGAV